jgi:hypothetical protein
MFWRNMTFFRYRTIQKLCLRTFSLKRRFYFHLHQSFNGPHKNHGDDDREGQTEGCTEEYD